MADALLEQLAGEWIGKGTGIQRPGAPSESLYCRIASEIVEDGAALEQTGRCALGNDTGALQVRIRALAGGLYDGTMTSPAMRGAAAIAGTGGGRRLELEAVYEDSKTGRPIRSLVSLSVIADGQYRMVTRASDAATGEPGQSSDVLFRRQEP